MSKHSIAVWTCTAALAAACSADVAMGPHAVPGAPRFTSGQRDPPGVDVGMPRRRHAAADRSDRSTG